MKKLIITLALLLALLPLSHAHAAVVQDPICGGNIDLAVTATQFICTHDGIIDQIVNR